MFYGLSGASFVQLGWKDSGNPQGKCVKQDSQVAATHIQVTFVSDVYLEYSKRFAVNNAHLFHAFFARA